MSASFSAIAELSGRLQGDSVAGFLPVSHSLLMGGLLLCPYFDVCNLFRKFLERGDLGALQKYLGQSCLEVPHCVPDAQLPAAAILSAICIVD